METEGFSFRSSFEKSLANDSVKDEAEERRACTGRIVFVILKREKLCLMLLGRPRELL